LSTQGHAHSNLPGSLAYRVRNNPCSGKQKALNGKLTDELGASSSQRTTYRNLSPSAFGPYQQEARDIYEPDE
jgi:hypothetical protein